MKGKNMPNQEPPATLSHLEVQLTALLQRSMKDDVPTDVHHMIVEAFAKVNVLKGELNAQAAKKPVFRRN
jgi:hypothetical protein